MRNSKSAEQVKNLSKVIKIDETQIKDHLGQMVRRVEDITEALWGMRVNAGTVSDLNQKMYERIDKWRSRPIEGRYPYVYMGWHMSQTQLGS